MENEGKCPKESTDIDLNLPQHLPSPRAGIQVPVAEDLLNSFNARIFDQERLIGQFVSHFIAQRNNLAHGEKEKPIFCLLLGPPGVGKTYFARVAAEVVFGSSDSRVGLNFCALPTEPVELKRSLLGIEPRYGGASAGLLTGPLESNPRQVVLLDEIHLGGGKLVFEILNSLADGYLRDNYIGAQVGVRETIFLAATDAHYDEVLRAERKFLSTLPPNTRIARELKLRRNFILDFLIQKGVMRPEAKDRITAVMIFTTLSLRGAAILIVKLSVTAAKERGMRLLQTKGLEAVVDAGLLYCACPPHSDDEEIQIRMRMLHSFLDKYVVASLNNLNRELLPRSNGLPPLPVELSWDGQRVLATICQQEN